MKLVAVMAGMAGALTGMVSTWGLMIIIGAGVKLPPSSLDDVLGVMALALCALGVVGSVMSMSGRLAGVLLLAAGGGFLYFLPGYAIPAAPLFLVSAAASILAN